MALYFFLQQPKAPRESDVFRNTVNWSPSVKEVYLVNKVNDKWITVFSTENTLFLGELQQKWLGKWVLIDKSGNPGPLSSALFPPDKDEDVIWGASQIGDVSIYFGIIINPEVAKIVIVVGDKTYDVPIYKSLDGKRFYYLERMSKTVPFTLTGLSKEGEIVFTDQQRLRAD